MPILSPVASTTTTPAQICRGNCQDVQDDCENGSREAFLNEMLQGDGTLLTECRQRPSHGSAVESMNVAVSMTSLEVLVRGRSRPDGAARRATILGRTI